MPGTDFAYLYWAELQHEIQTGSSSDSLSEYNYIYNHYKIYLRPPLKTILDNEREFYYNIPHLCDGIVRLAPYDMNSTFSFVVFGDNKSTHKFDRYDESYQKILELAQEKDPDFLVNTGDIVFEGRDYRDWIKFFKISSNFMRTIPYFPTVGNHESSSKPLFKIFEFPGDKSYYSFNWGQIHFIVLNSCGLDPRLERRNYPETKWKQYLDEFDEKIKKPFFTNQLEWLKNDLESHKNYPFIFVSFHYPVFNSMDIEIENTDIILNDWFPLFKEYQISAVFNGHNHYYHHVLEDNIHFIITAGGGGGLYSRSDRKIPGEIKFAKEYHFIHVSAKPSSCIFTVHTINDEIIESYEINERNW